MTSWNDLRKNALLGTGKMPLQEDSLPLPIQEALSQINKNDQEGYFLKAAMMVLAYTKAGQSPINILLPEIVVAQQETQEFCSKEAVFVLKKLTQSEHFNPYLFDFFVEKCVEKNWVLPENMLVEVLNKCNQKTLEKTHQILGVRGKWLTQFNDSWQIKEVIDNEKLIWEEGKPNERKEFFAQIRHKNPQKAIELLQNSWNNESAKDRKDFVNLLEINLTKKDEAFLNEKYDELANGNSNQKPITIEIIQRINLLKLMIPDSDLGNKIFGKIADYIERKKGFLSGLGLGNPMKLNLPKNEDFFWNSTEMNQNFGFEKLSSIKGISDAQYWFGELVRKLHPQSWIDYFEGDFKKVMLFFEEAEGMNTKKKPLFLYQFSEAMQLAENTQIQYFVENLQENLKLTKWNDLLKKVYASMRESLIMKHLSLDIATLRVIMAENNDEWSLDFSTFVLKNLAAEIQMSNYISFSDKDFVNRLSIKLPVKVSDKIIDFGSAIAQDWHRNFWKNNFSENLLKQLDIKEGVSKM